MQPMPRAEQPHPDDGYARFDGVLRAELRCIAARRLAARQHAFDPATASKNDSFDAGLVGLALSGGGIRSASFNLGLLQALGKWGVLEHTDYLSTVSGGGYIGSCLSSLCASPHADVKPGSATFPFAFNGHEENRVIKYLRQHAQYLDVNQGVLHEGTWRAISAYLGGLLVSVATVLLLLAVLAGIFFGVYPWLLYLMPGGGGDPAQVAFDYAYNLSEVPRSFISYLMAPALAAIGLWVLSGLAYAVANLRPGLWTIRFRGGLARVQAYTLASAAFLAIIGALPLLFRQIDKLLGTANVFVPTISISALSLGGILSFGQQAQQVMTVAARFKRWLTAIGAWVLVGMTCLLVLYGVWWSTVTLGSTNVALWIAVAALAGLALLSVLTDVNRFSMYYFYRDCLSRAFVIKQDGGGEPKRNDDLKLCELDYSNRRIPYHLVNACVNLPGSTNAALRDRRADFFLFSPLYCGSQSTGYRPTSEYEIKGNPIKLATAMAVSGAAANPQFGSRTRPAYAFLITVLNARLGQWCHNPKYGESLVAHAFWPIYLFAELLSVADEKHRLVNVSDGGHIENMGVYELLRRRCKIIIASDCGTDPACAFNDLGNLMRKARIDYGIRIDINVSGLRKQAEHVAVGTIAYPDTAGRGAAKRNGILILVKPALTPRDPIDLWEYKASNDAFPQDSTLDQFFDESQFESYRALGYESGRAVCMAARKFGLSDLGTDGINIQSLMATAPETEDGPVI